MNTDQGPQERGSEGEEPRAHSAVLLKMRSRASAHSPARTLSRFKCSRGGTDGRGRSVCGYEPSSSREGTSDARGRKRLLYQKQQMSDHNIRGEPTVNLYNSIDPWAQLWACVRSDHLNAGTVVNWSPVKIRPRIAQIGYTYSGLPVSPHRSSGASLLSFSSLSSGPPQVFLRPSPELNRDRMR
uniref:Uncharacterized protein LOC117367420 isoform X2 n=1 Tax=Geotrypetes seraphini TaxID=260995 RepID=A0A6P8SB49_GEOSA|nr:uncharacterized protein LOC117367420 isoform X2 [Geotrypetes seraphini]